MHLLRQLLRIATTLSLFAIATVDATIYRVGIIDQAKPFSWVDGNQYRGVSVDLWHDIAKKNLWHIEYVNMGPDIQHAMDLLKQGQIDVLVGPIPINISHENRIQFGSAYYLDQTGILLKKTHRGFWEVLRDDCSTGFYNILLLTLIVFMVGIHIIWWIEQKTIKKMRPYRKGIIMIAWSFFTTLVGLAITYTPSHLSAHLIKVIWVSISLLFMTGISGLITSAMTTSHIRKDFHHIESIRGKHFGYVTGSLAEGFIKHGEVLYDIRLNPYPTFTEALNALNNETVEGIVGQQEVLLSAFPTDSNKTYMMSHLTLNKSLISFAFAHRLNIKESMDDAITHAQHNGSLYRICHRYLDMYSVDKCLAEI